MDTSSGMQAIREYCVRDDAALDRHQIAEGELDAERSTTLKQDIVTDMTDSHFYRV